MPRCTGFLQRMTAGFLIGLGCVLPGVSGGVMAVSFGLYQPMLDAVLDFFHDTKAKLRFLLPLAAGGALGMLAGAEGLSRLMIRHEALMLFLFCGFILGGVPQLWRDALQGEKLKPARLWWLLGGIALALPLALADGQGVPVAQLSPAQGLMTGVLEGVGTVVPGVSTSLVLIRLGWYQAYLAALSTLHFQQLAFIGTGFAVSAFLCMKGIQWLFNHMPGPAYAAVLGFLLVSVVLVLPPFHAGTLLWADLGLMVIGAVCAHWLGQLTSSKGVNK